MKYEFSSAFCLPRQDSWTTRNPRNNGANWGIIRYLLSWKTTGRLPFFFFKGKNVKVIVNRVYIVCTPLKVIVNSVLPGDYSGCELKIVLLYYMDRFPRTYHVECVVLLSKVQNWIPKKAWKQGISESWRYSSGSRIFSLWVICYQEKSRVELTGWKCVRLSG